jgi:hypothetical protein
MIRMIRSAMLVLVLAHLVASAAFALPRTPHPAPVPEQGLTQVWGWIVSWFAPAEPVAKAPGGGIMTKAGSIMDPNGCPQLGTICSGMTTDAGPGMDPDGLK